MFYQNKIYQKATLIILALLLQSACQPSQESTQPTLLSSDQSTTTTPMDFTGTSEASEPSDAITEPDQELLVSTPTPTPLSNATPPPNIIHQEDPLKIDIPTPGPIPASAWRPSLYPVPWALSPFDHFYFTRPVAADNVNWPLPEYRYGAINFGPSVPHTGVDIVVDEGTPIIAAGDGEVASAGYGIYSGTEDPNDPYGKAIVIRHNFGYQGEPLFTIYGHLSDILVFPGQRIKTGDIIGISGDTGLTTGPHLHFEIRIGENQYWSTRNPELWLVPPQGWGVVAGRITNAYGHPLLSPQDYLADFTTGTRIRVTNLDTNQYWWGNTYGAQITIRPDDYYQENFVISDLPSGNYEVMLNYLGDVHRLRIKIHPGAITFFSFNTLKGFSTDLPFGPIPDNLPISREQ
jgi:murein DD-endopeptidase MepM/ murein hydrolase activator NlpD